jgi:hypothetical protein
MDRNHRTDLRAKNAHLAVKNQAYDKNKISLDFQLEQSNPISTELIKEINDLKREKKLLKEELALRIKSSNSGNGK